MTAKAPEVWAATIPRPYKLRHSLGQSEHVRQCRVLGRASSRAEFARKLIAVGLEHRSPTAVSAWLRDFGGITRNAQELAAVTDDRVYLTSLNASDAPFVAYPPDVTA